MVLAIFLIFIVLLTGCDRNMTDEQTVNESQDAVKESDTKATADNEETTAQVRTI